jgi:2-polyprenyl-6-methoxyphenol hydroxylase-like FAD-dependent oxidoreductase
MIETPFTRMHDRYDVVVAGARCAGAATAMLMARAGLRVLMVDPAPPTRDTLSTHALMRGGVLQLHRWGLLSEVVAAGTPRIGATVFDYGEHEIEIPIAPKDGVDGLYAPRRVVLDPILNQAAVREGVHVAYGVRVADLARSPAGRVVGVRLAGRDRTTADVGADLVVGADGKNSSVATLAGAPIERMAEHTSATVYGYVRTTADLACRYRWSFAAGRGAPGVSMGIIPTNQGETCVFASMAPEVFQRAGRHGMSELYLSTLARMNGALAARLREVADQVRTRGFAGQLGVVRKPYGPGWALVGDAGLFRDPATAHGITDAFRDAETLVRAWVEDGGAGLARYHEARDATSLGLFETTDRIAGGGWSPDELGALHHALSRQMNLGVELIRAWGALPDVAAPAARMPARHSASAA